MYKVWIGKRESDILTYKYFDYSITYYGSDALENSSYCKTYRWLASYSNDFIDFVVSKVQTIFERHKNEDVKFYFYNNVFAHKIINKYPRIKEHIENINNIYILNTLRHKTLSRLWLCNYVATPSFCLLSKSDCTLQNLLKKFGREYERFIIQKNYSSGGTGTYLINKANEHKILNKLDNRELYLVSPYYYPNCSLSCHIMIDKEKCTVFPILEQTISTKNDNFKYCGNQYINQESTISKKVRSSAQRIGIKLQSLGYKGICGLDFIFCNNKVFLIEINPRYQGSSYYINFLLKENRLPSLFELNDMCFKETIPHNVCKQIELIEANHFYSKCVIYEDEEDIQSIYSLIEDTNILFLDGCNKSCKFEKGCYLFRYISPLNEF